MRPLHWREGKTPKHVQKQLRAQYGKPETKHKLPRHCAARHHHISARRARKAAA